MQHRPGGLFKQPQATSVLRPASIPDVKNCPGIQLSNERIAAELAVAYKQFDANYHFREANSSLSFDYTPCKVNVDKMKARTIVELMI